MELEIGVELRKEQDDNGIISTQLAIAIIRIETHVQLGVKWRCHAISCNKVNRIGEKKVEV